MFAAMVCLLSGVPARAAEQTVTLAGLKVTVWADPQAGTVKQPVIIFSHGFHGCATQSRFLMEAFAAAGYIVFAPNHRDATCDGGASTWFNRPITPFRGPDKWSDATYRDRADDIRNLIAAIARDQHFGGIVDMSRLGLCGHSLGGYTVLGLGGAWPSWKLPGVKAVLALSPYSQPFLVHDTIKDLSVPVMYQGGTRDFGITPFIDKSQGAYDQSPEPKYFVEFDEAGHFAWTNMTSEAHEDITAYSLAFMNHYVKGASADAALTNVMPGVTELRYQSEIGSRGIASNSSADRASAPR
jgi:predicted dienelactone hydrolase